LDESGIYAALKTGNDDGCSGDRLAEFAALQVYQTPAALPSPRCTYIDVRYKPPARRRGRFVKCQSR